MYDTNKFQMTDGGFEYFADDFQYNPTVMTFNLEWGTAQRVFGSWTPSTYWLPDWWGRYPRLIRQANNFIEKAHPIPKESLTQREVDLMKAECRFLKAYYWWSLAEVYGPIPYHEGNIASDASGEELFAPRIPLDDLVEILDKEFKAVAELLPVKYAETRKYGRATKLMAMIERARMLLFWASPLVNGNPDYAHYMRPGIDPKPLINPAYDHNKMIRAAKAWKEVIELAEANGYALSKVYNSDGTIDPFLSVQSVKFDTNNNEITWPATNSHDIWFVNQGQPTDLNGANILGTTLDLVDDFFMENGLRRGDDGSGYVEDGFTTGVHKRNDTAWDGGTGVAGEITADHTYNMFANREPRFYVAIRFTGAWCHPANRKYDFRRGGADNDGGWQTNRAGLAMNK
ncbi:MAG: RagB/SusD family nutrient uptake outer membrane protein, partial [Muribaculaceae bacterium]|nr:RagB/SusD family nutrient uptake outer membrane protein [Muribaculaceae bacterium]